MKHMPALLFSLLALTGLPAMAQDRIVSPSPANGATLDLYEQPATAEPGRRAGAARAAYLAQCGAGRAEPARAASAWSMRPTCNAI